jgi:hypothetical protein
MIITKRAENITESKHECPVCKEKMCLGDMDKDVVLYCGRKKCTSVGANEGAYGKNEAEAYAVFRSKMGLDKK